MIGVLTCYDGTQYQLPTLLAWKLQYTAGVPCDSFWLRCCWESGEELVLRDAIRFLGTENGETVFSGVVDECEVTWCEEGCLLEISGRGMAALLLDNEAEAADYQTATVADILRDHVEPYGVAVGGREALPAVSGFSVSSGSSEWSVLYEFARYYGGVAPRFNREGELLLTKWTDNGTLQIDDTTPVTELVCRDRRYGVLSEVLVRDKVRQAVESVENTTFKNRGGQSRQILSMPGRSSYKVMRYSGQFQLDKSKAELIQLEITVPIAFLAAPGELIRLSRSNWGRNGTYRVMEAAVEENEDGTWTTLVLGDRDAVM